MFIASLVEFPFLKRRSGKGTRAS